MKYKTIHLIFLLLITSLQTGCEQDEALVQKEDKKSVIIFTDAGAEIDDQWMLVHLMGLEKISIKAIFSSHHGGLSAADEAVESSNVIDAVTEMTGNSHIQTFTGSNYRLKSKNDINHSTADFIYNLVQEYSNDDKMIAVISGPATDMAGALNKYPSISNRIEICATAFYSRERGTGYNVHNDPLAWQILLDKDIAITVSPNQVSKKSFLITSNEMQDLTNADNETAHYLSENYFRWLTKNEKIVTQITGNNDTWPIWDQILSAYLSGYCKTEETARPILQDNGYLNYDGGGENRSLRWITECDSNKTWHDFKIILKNHGMD